MACFCKSTTAVLQQALPSLGVTPPPPPPPPPALPDIATLLGSLASAALNAVAGPAPLPALPALPGAALAAAIPPLPGAPPLPGMPPEPGAPPVPGVSAVPGLPGGVPGGAPGGAGLPGAPGLAAPAIIAAAPPVPAPPPPPPQSLVGVVQGLAGILGGAGLPAPPWKPNPSWQSLQLPKPSLSSAGMATISAFGQLRSDTQSLLSIDIAKPGQGAGLADLAASTQGQIAAMIDDQPWLAAPAPPGLLATRSPMSWPILSAALSAAQQVLDAIKQGVMPAPPDGPPGTPLPPPPGPPIAPYRPFLSQLPPLLPLISASNQLGIDLSGDLVAQLAPILRAMRSIAMPSFTSPQQMLMAVMTGNCGAIGALAKALGVDPVSLGMKAVQPLVADVVNSAGKAIQAAFGVSPASLLASLTAAPRLPFSPGLMATPAVVAAAQSIDPASLAALNWPVPPAADIPVLAVGQPVVAFVASVRDSVGVAPVSAACPVCTVAGLLG